MISSFFSFRFKFTVKLFLQGLKNNSSKFFEEPVREKRVYIFLAADYGNLGDVAITYAQTQFLREFSNFEVVEIPISKSIEGIHFVKKHVQRDDIITTVGGGNLGDLYDQIEFIRQTVVMSFPKHKIISFPQTFDFAESPEGITALKRAKKVYNNHKNLTFVAREKLSFELMTEHFNFCNVILTPDIVLSLSGKFNVLNERKGVTLCMRQDAEKQLSIKDQEDMIHLLEKRFNIVNYYDTHINKNEIPVDVRLKELNNIWEVFQNSELVITDRLHGMIFCYITNTPCLVFPNSNHKVAGTVDWFKKTSTITLMEYYSKEMIEQYLFNVPKSNNNYVFIEEYEQLIKLIND